MKYGYSRTERVSELILQEVSLIIRKEVKDPGVGFVTLIAVEVSDDLRNARIYISVMGDEKEKKTSLRALNRARGFIRSSFGSKVRLKYLPEMTFFLDRSLDRVKRINDILREIGDSEEPEENR